MTKKKRVHTHLVENQTPLEMVSSAISGSFNHVVHRNQKESFRELRATVLMQKSPQRFLEYPLSSSLDPKAASHDREDALTLQEWRCYSLLDKDNVISQIIDLFEQSRLNASLRDDVTLTASEFLCNAFFNAPNPSGINNRTLEKTISEASTPLKQPIVLKMGAFNGYLAISCQDNFGTLRPQRILERFMTCLQNGIGESINFDDKGTAGIGCYMIFNACTSFFMASEAGKRTQFCVLFPLTSGARSRSQMKKNLHWVAL